MRRSESPDAGFGARILASDKAALGAILPMMGGQKWAVETALERFLDMCDTDPTLVRRVRRLIDQQNMNEPPRGLDQLLPRVKTGLHERFMTQFRDKGATTWFVRTFVRCLIEQYDNIPLPEVQVQGAVETMLGLSEPRVSDYQYLETNVDG